MVKRRRAPEPEGGEALLRWWEGSLKAVEFSQYSLPPAGLSRGSYPIG